PAAGAPRPASLPVRDPVLERALSAEQELRVERDRSRGYLARLEELVGTDPVTGLPGRQRITEQLETALWSASAGDELLRAVAGRLRGALRRKDLLARLGGHEFLVAVRDLRPDVARAQALRIGSELLDLVRRPVRLHDTDVPVGA